MHRRLNIRDAFPKSADEYAQQVERFLQVRRADMDAAWGKIEEGWNTTNERMVKFGLSPRSADEDVVKLNIGGLNFTVCWHLLAEAEGFKDSALGALIEGVWGKDRIPRDADGRIVLDESPVCINLIIVQTLLRARNGRASSAAEGLPESSARSAVAVDEVPYLIYTAHVMGPPESVPTHPKYVKIAGGSTVLEPFDIAPFGAKIREWVGGSVHEMTLIYRATRDGFDTRLFQPRFNEDTSSHVVSVVRVSSGQENDDDSVVGGYSVGPWNYDYPRRQRLTAEMFVFMLKDGGATQKDPSKPTKWNLYDGFAGRKVGGVQEDNVGVSVGGVDLCTVLDESSGGYTLNTGQDLFEIEGSSPFLALNGKKVVDVEVYRCSTPASPTTTTPSTTEPNGDALTDAEAHDIHSFGQSIASSLKEERTVLDRAVKEMEAAGERVTAAVSALETVYGPSVAAGEQDAVVELNVRGTRVTTLRSTLQACPRSALAAMFNEDRWPATNEDKDEHGRRLIDCNATCFSKILDVLRVRNRASWSRGVAEGKQEEASRGVPSGAVLVKEADMEVFGEAVNMYFPGCESFIMDVVQPV